MTRYTFLWLAMAALAGCGDKTTANRPDNLLTGNDFEEMEGWIGDTQMPALTKEKAHSGVYSVHVGPGVEYSNGFNGTLGKISPSRITQVQVKGWVYVPANAASVSLITQLNNPADASGKPVLWEALPLDKAAKSPNQWVEVEKTLTLPANTGSNFKLQVYLWNGGSGAVAYLDDLQILRAKQ